MNLLFICNEYPPGRSGGIGSITRALARSLVAAGHQVFVAGLYAPGYGQADYEEDQGVRVWRRRFGLDIGLIRNDYSKTDTLLLELFRRSGLSRRDTVRSVRAFSVFVGELIGKFRIDLVEWPDFNEYFAHLPASFSWPALPVPLVVKFHGTASYIYRQMQEPVDQTTFLLEKKHMERADALVSVSRNTAENYASFYGLTRRIGVLYNSIEFPGVRTNGLSPTDDKAGGSAQTSDPAGIPSPEAARTIVYTGALSRVKGIHSLMEAWPLVLRKRPDAILRVFGKGRPSSLLARLPEQARNSVRFEGFVTKDRLYEALSGAAAAIFPSYTECFALAPLEAMAVGCPVIFTERVSGPELIETGVNGLLINPDDYGQMAEAMLSLLEDVEKRKTFSRNGRQTILERFDIRKSVKDHIRFYEELIINYQARMQRSDPNRTPAQNKT